MSVYFISIFYQYILSQLLCKDRMCFRAMRCCLASEISSFSRLCLIADRRKKWRRFGGQDNH